MADNDDEDLPVFSTLMLAFGSILAMIIVIWFALANVKATSNTIIQLSQRGAANVSRLANNLVNSTKVYVLQALPQIEHTAVDVFNAVDNGVESSFNSIAAAGTSIVSSAVSQFTKLALLIGDFGQQVSSLFLQFLEPGFEGLKAFCDDLQSGFNYTATLYQAIADIVNAVVDLIRTAFHF